MGLSSDRPTLDGKTDPIQPAALLISLNGGRFSKYQEDLIMEGNTQNSCQILQFPESRIVKTPEQVKASMHMLLACMQAAKFSSDLSNNQNDEGRAINSELNALSNHLLKFSGFKTL